MIKFQHIEALYLLLLIVPMIAVFILFMFWRKSALKKFGEWNLVRQLSPMQPRWKHQIKFILFLFAFLFAVIGLANPQFGTNYQKVKRNGVDIFIALDVSRSMMAEDVKPNRLDRATRFISKMLDKTENDRVGLIVFAGQAYMQMPLTSDYSSAKMLLKNVNTNMVPTQGTVIAEAIRMAQSSFIQGEDKHKALVIITDGEGHDDDAETAAQEAAKNGIIIHTIGVGTSKGAPIPVANSSGSVDYKKDSDGNIVLSKLDETSLQKIASFANGHYYNLSSSGNSELDDLMNQIGNMEKKELQSGEFTNHASTFQIFLGIALFLLIIEFLISERRSSVFSDWNIFKTKEVK